MSKIIVVEVNFYDSTWEHVVSSQHAAFYSEEAANEWAYSAERYEEALLEAEKGEKVERASELLFRTVPLY